MNRLQIVAALFLATLGTPAVAQETTNQEGTVVRQVRIPVDQVLGQKLKVPKQQLDEMKEMRRHNREVERTLARMAKGNRFALPRAPRQPRSVRTLPANSNAY